MKTITMAGLFGLVLGICLAGIMLADSDTSSASGNDLGNGVSWSIENQVLIISYSGTGSGEMPDYAKAKAPWYEQAQHMGNDSVRGIVVKEGVTRIGDYCFFDCSQTKFINIPGTVKTIGRYGCASLCNITTLTLPEGVEALDDCAFSGCTELNTVVLPDSLTTIGSSSICGNVKKITFGTGIQSVGYMWSSNPCEPFEFYLEPGSTTHVDFTNHPEQLAGKTFEYGGLVGEFGHWGMFAAPTAVAQPDPVTESEVPVCVIAALMILGCLGTIVYFNRH